MGFKISVTRFRSSFNEWVFAAIAEAGHAAAVTANTSASRQVNGVPEENL